MLVRRFEMLPGGFSHLNYFCSAVRSQIPPSQCVRNAVPRNALKAGDESQISPTEWFRTFQPHQGSLNFSYTERYSVTFGRLFYLACDADQVAVKGPSLAAHCWTWTRPSPMTEAYHMSQRLSLVLADDHPAVLEGLSNFLGSFSDINVVAKCSDGVAALNNICKFAPNVAVLDMVMPGLTGLEILSIIRQSANETKAVILTAYASEADLVAAIERGASSIVHKDTTLEDIVHCIREAAQGRPWQSPEIAATIARYQSCTSVASRILKPLTEREYQIAMLVSEGLSNKEIGHELSICEGTVKIHLHKIYEKTRLSNRTMLAAIVKQCPAPKF